MNTKNETIAKAQKAAKAKARRKEAAKAKRFDATRNRVRMFAPPVGHIEVFPPKADIEISGGGTIYLAHPLTPAGRAWLTENIPEGPEVQYWAEALAVEHGYIADIVAGMRNDGLIVV